MARIRRAVMLVLMTAAVVVMAVVPAMAAKPDGKTNMKGGGNVTCSVYGLDELKLDDAPSFVGQVVRNRDVAVRITAIKRNSDGDSVAFMWEQLRGDPIERVHIKAGTSTKMYLTPWAEGHWLWSPTKGELGSGTRHREISNIRWCY
ncbi:MAG: hypothetical protein U9R51_03385 [Actinomycetota bacterium]|nr:hypothetical protein [Actinomycetota bacterium]